MSRPGTRDDHERFCKTEGWTTVRGAHGAPVRHHVTFTLTLADGRTLCTRISRPVDTTTYGPGLWHHILTVQLDVSEEVFWRCVDDGVMPRRGHPTAPPQALPVSLAGLYEMDRGRRFGDQIHRLLDVFPPVVADWPSRDIVLPMEWKGGEEEKRWKGIVEALRSSEFFRRLCSCRLVGTELSMLKFGGGHVSEDRADLVVRAPDAAGSPPKEHWVVDYKTGEREQKQEEQYLQNCLKSKPLFQTGLK